MRLASFSTTEPLGTKGIWRWTQGESTWQQRVPAPDSSAKEARRFFVDPYDPNLIYIVDQDGIKPSEDGGHTWHLDISLDRAVTENKSFPYDIQRLPIWVSDIAVINDMLFDPQERGTRFAVGTAGVFFTLDGKNWRQLLSTQALPGYPVGAHFDRISDPSDRALYVAMNGRGILRLSPIPTLQLVNNLVAFELVIRVNGVRSLLKVLLSARNGGQATPTRPGGDVVSR